MLQNSFQMKQINDRFNVSNTIIMVVILSLSIPLNSQTVADESRPQFLYPDFVKSEVTLKSKKVEILKLNYNTISEKMVFELDSNLYEIVNPGLVDTIYMQDCKFIPVVNVFYEVLLVAPISLFVQHKSKLLPPGKQAGYGVTSQTSNTRELSSIQRTTGAYNLKLASDYTVKAYPVFWIRIDNIWNSFINERQFLKIFPEKGGELKQFIKQNRIKFDNQSNLVKLVEHCNNLNQ